MKSWPEFFEEILRGRKTHDLRRNDRDFREGDVLVLKEYDPRQGKYTGRSCNVEVTYITSQTQACALSEEALKEGFSILSIRRIA